MTPGTTSLPDTVDPTWVAPPALHALLGDPAVAFALFAVLVVVLACLVLSKL